MSDNPHQNTGDGGGGFGIEHFIEFGWCAWPFGGGMGDWEDEYCKCEKITINQKNAKEACEEFGGTWFPGGDPNDGDNPEENCKSFCPDVNGNMAECLAMMNAIADDHIQKCRDIYNEDMALLNRLMHEWPLDLVCQLWCTIENLYCDCKRAGEEKRCMLLHSCWLAYDLGHGTDGAGPGYEGCMGNIPDCVVVAPAPGDIECECEIIAESREAGDVIDHHSKGGKLIEKMYQNHYSLIDSFANSPTPDIPDGGGGKGSNILDPLGGEDKAPIRNACLMYDASGYCNCIQGQIEEHYCCCSPDSGAFGGAGGCDPYCSSASFYPGMSCDMLDCSGPEDNWAFNECMNFINVAAMIMLGGCEGKYDEDSGEYIPLPDAERCKCLKDAEAWYCYALRDCYKIYDENNGTNGAEEAYRDCKAQATLKHPECRTGPGPTWGEGTEGTSESTYGGGDVFDLPSEMKTETTEGSCIPITFPESSCEQETCLRDYYCGLHPHENIFNECRISWLFGDCSVNHSAPLLCERARRGMNELCNQITPESDKPGPGACCFGDVRPRPSGDTQQYCFSVADKEKCHKLVGGWCGAGTECVTHDPPDAIPPYCPCEHPDTDWPMGKAPNSMENNHNRSLNRPLKKSNKRSNKERQDFWEDYINKK